MNVLTSVSLAMILDGKANAAPKIIAAHAKATIKPALALPLPACPTSSSVLPDTMRLKLMLILICSFREIQSLKEPSSDLHHSIQKRTLSRPNETYLSGM